LAAFVLTKESTSDAWATIKCIIYPSTPVQQGTPGTYPNKPNQLQALTNELRVSYKGLTAHLNAPSLKDQGVLYAAQWADRAQQLPLKGSNDDLANNHVWRYTGFPSDINQLYNKTAKVVQWEARDGCYIPLRFVNPTSNFSESGDLPALIQIAFGAETAPTLTLGDGAFGTSLDGADWFTDAEMNTTASVMFFMGIDGTATIDAKARCGMEAVPSATSAWGPFMENSPHTDAAAIDVVQNIAKTTAGAYPARYNDLGLLWSKIISPLLKASARAILPGATAMASKWANS
jgi:hypothetical protein